MKKYHLMLLLLIVMVLSLCVAGCRKGDSTGSPNSSSVVSSQNSYNSADDSLVNSINSTNNNSGAVTENSSSFDSSSSSSNLQLSTNSSSGNSSNSIHNVSSSSSSGNSSSPDSEGEKPSTNLPSTATLNGLTFTLLSDNTYMVSGFDDSTSIVSIPEKVNGAKVTSIGSFVFKNCKNLASVEIPKSVTSIGDDAFYSCISLTKVNYTGTIDDWVQIQFDSSFANPVYYAKKLYLNDILVTEANITEATKISDYAFYNCSSLTSITIGNNVTHIGNYAFGGCYSLSSVTIGSGVTSIGDYSFNDCSNITKATIPTIAISYIPKTNLKEVIINSGSSINKKAFYDCRSLTNVTIGSGVKSIGGSAFYGCESLVKVNYTGTIDGWVQIEFISSESNPLYYAKKLYINDQLVTEANITTATKISSYAFDGCRGLTSVTFGNSVKSIGDYAFDGCSDLASLIIGNSVICIGDYSFRVCGLTNVTIGNSITSIGHCAFWGCYNLKRVNYTGTIDDWAQIEFWDEGSNPIIYSKKLYINDELVTEANITTAIKISSYAFDCCRGLTSVTIPDTVTSIGEYAFYYCFNLMSVTIGNSVTSIGENAFYNCDKLVEVVNKSSNITIIKGSTANGYIGYYALAVYNSALFNDNGYIVCTEGTEKILIAYQGEETNLIIPCYITQIKAYAFYECSSLTSIEIPNSVTLIGGYAFYGCSRLTSVIIGDSVEVIGEHAFNHCYSLKNVTIGGGVTSIGERAFSDCCSLTSIEIPNSVTSIGNYAFYYCYKLIEVYNKSNLNIVENSTDYGYVGCYAKNIYTPTSGQSKLSTDESDFVIYTNGNNKILVSYIGIKTDLILPRDITEIYNYAFFSCSKLTSIEIPNSVTTIGAYAFYNCDGLTSVTFANTSGWWYSSSSTATSGTSISQEDLANTSTAATYLKDTYTYYYWKRS